MHVYHYGAYEVSALRRLAGRHGTREEIVDGLLRSGVLIDLYEVVRHGLLLGEPSYSIKNVERLYRPKRDTEVGKGDQSVAAYNSWLDAPDGPDASTSETLRSLAEYNRDDCESTRALADWLWKLRCERCGQPPAAPTASEAAGTPDEASPEAAEGEAAGEGDADLPRVVDEEAAVARLEALLCDKGVRWSETSVLCDAEVRETLSGMLRFHRREAKPQWWRRYEWIALPPAELVADPRTLGELHRTEREPFKSAPRKRRLAYEYRWAHSQQSNLCEASNVVLRDDAPFMVGAVLGAPGNGAAAEATALTNDSGEEPRSLGATLLSLDRTTGLAIIECGQEPPQQLSVLPNEFVDGAPVARALRQVAAAMVAEPTTRTALGELLARRRPTVALPSAAAHAAADGTPPAEGPMAPVCAGEDVVDAAVARVLALRRSYLCVQGPPGTGKTYTAARCIAALVAQGRRVGVMAVSHRAVTHLMRQSLELIAEAHGRRGAPGEPVDGHGTITRDVRSCAAVRLGGSAEELDELKRVCAAASEGARGSKGDGVGRAGTILSVRQLSGASGLKKGGLAAAELLVGGTAWAMASEELCAQLDVLFIDEAGQLPLAQLAGASRSAQSLVLLGDQMQLPAPTEGHHPAASGASCLEYLLQGAETVPPALGLFLPTSYRLHPALCELVSRLSYRGKLKPHAATAARKIALAPVGSSELVRRALGDLPRAPQTSPELPRAPVATQRSPTLCVAGVAHVPVEHEGNSQASTEESVLMIVLIAPIATECRGLPQLAGEHGGGGAHRVALQGAAARRARVRERAPPASARGPARGRAVQSASARARGGSPAPRARGHSRSLPGAGGPRRAALLVPLGL